MKQLQFFIIFLFFLFSFFYASPVLATNTYDMSVSGNYNIRFDGPVTSGKLAVGSTANADFDGDGKSDIVVGAPVAGLNGKAMSGSIYIIYSSLLAQYSGTGKTLDLDDPANYNLRIDGASTTRQIGYYWHSIRTADVNSDGKPDLLFFSAGEHADRAFSGSVYVIYNALIAKYKTTGNIIDLSDNTTYSLRFDGAEANDMLGWEAINTADINGDGKLDLLLGAGQIYNAGASYKGHAYVIYNNLFAGYAGPGQVIDLADNHNYNLRFDGAAYKDYLTYDATMHGVDFNGNDKLDLLFGSKRGDGNGTDSGYLYIIYDNLFSQYTDTGHTFDLANADNYSLRIDGAVAGDQFGFEVNHADFDNDGRDDLIATAWQATQNGRSKSGSLYLISSTLFDAHTEADKIMVLSNEDHYSYRVDGPEANTGGLYGGMLGDMGLNVGDLDSDGRKDVVVSSPAMSDQSGASFVLYNSLINSYTSKNIDLATTSNYSRRYNGANGCATNPGIGGTACGDHLTAAGETIGDINGDGQNELLLDAHQTSFNSRGLSGSLYLVYNFPHTISLTLQGKDRIMGTVSTPNSTTAVAGVQYNYNSNNPLSSGWTNCSGTTSFTCTLTNFPSGSINKVYIRAFDTNGSYTAQSSYALTNYNDNTSSGPLDPNCPWNYKYCITSGPNHYGSDSFLNNMGIWFFAFNTTHHDDLYTQLIQRSPDYLSSQTPRIPFPWEQGFNTASEFYEVKVLSAFNGYPIPILNNPATLILPYDISKLTTNNINPTKLRIASYNKTTKKWQTIPNNTVLNWVNKTLSNTTKIFNTYFVVGYGSTNLTSNVLVQEDNKPIISPIPTIISRLILTPTPQLEPTAKPKNCFLFFCW